MTATLAATSKRLRSYRTKAFRESFAKLPEQIQETARRKFRLFAENPGHPSLKTGNVQNAGRPANVVWVDYSHRAVFRVGGLPHDDNVFVWEWIGTTEEFTSLYMSGRGPSSSAFPPSRHVPAPTARPPKKRRSRDLSSRERRNARIAKVLERHPELTDRVAALFAPDPDQETITVNTSASTTAVKPKSTTIIAPATAAPVPASSTAAPAQKGEWTPARLATARAELMSLLEYSGRLLVDHPRAEKELYEVMEQHEASEGARKRLVAEIEQLKKLRTSLEERIQGYDARVSWLEKETERTRATAGVEQKLRQGVEQEVAALRDELQKAAAEYGSLQRRIEAVESEKAALASTATAGRELVKNLEAERAALRLELEKAKQARTVPAVAFQSSGKLYLINDFNPEQVPLSGAAFRMKPITKDKAEEMLAGGKFASGLSPRVAPLIGRVLGMNVERGRRPDLRPGDEAVLVSWQSRNAPRDGNMTESEFSVWSQWLRWDLVQILSIT